MRTERGDGNRASIGVTSRFARAGRSSKVACGCLRFCLCKSWILMPFVGWGLLNG